MSAGRTFVSPPAPRLKAVMVEMMKVMMAIMAVMEGNGRENEEGGKAIERKSGV